jgi:membrane protease YdiL (CAAX protease family)
MHMGKAEPEALGSIVAGVALGVLALRTRSFWYGVLVHASVAVWMDLLSASPALFPKLWSSGT